MLTTGEVSSTALMTLFNLTTPQLPSDTFEGKDRWDFLVVDIKDGEFWLISRLFIFTVFLHAMRGIKCVAFVESKDEHRRRLIGLASPEAVRTALREVYPWLEEALSKAMVKQSTNFLDPSLPSGDAGVLIREFIKQPDMRQKSKPSSSDDKWTQLGTQPIWEHTEWLTPATVSGYLRKVFYGWDASHYKDSPDIQADKRMRELLRRTAPHIALVNSKGEFNSLLDRHRLLEQMAEQLTKAG